MNKEKAYVSIVIGFFIHKMNNNSNYNYPTGLSRGSNEIMCVQKLFAGRRA